VAPRPRQALPPLPLGEGNVSLGGGPKRHLACAPKGRCTPLSLGALRVCSRPLPRPMPGGSRHQRRGGFPHISPTSGPASRRTGAVSNGPHTGQGEPPAARSALPLQGPSVGYPCGPPPDSGPTRGPVSPPLPAHTKRSPSLGGPDYSGVPRAPSSSRGGTAP